MAKTRATRQVRPAPTAVRARRQPRRSGATTLKMPVQLAKATPAPHSVGLAGPGEAGEGLPVRPARLAGEFARRCACVLCAPARPRSCCAACARRPLAAPRRRRGAARVRAGGTTVACCVSVEVTAHCKLLSQSGLGASSRSPCAQRCRAAPPLPLDCSLWRASRSANAPAGGAHQPNGRFRGIPWAALAASRHAMREHRRRLCERRSPPSTPPAYPARSAGRTVPPNDARNSPTTAFLDLTSFRARAPRRSTHQTP